jgi:uncharacterized protein YjbI with pentapeptide repeats
MKRRYALLLTIALAVPTCAFGAPEAPSPAKHPPEASDAAEAQTLKMAEMKLAALAKEANADTKWAAETPAKKKKVASVGKKRHAKKKSLAGRAKGDPVLKVTSRRMTESEVQGILKTTRDLSGTDLSGINLVGADLSGVKFNRANLHLANLERADLAESDLELADLSGANLRGASLNQARLRGTRMEGTRMDGALWIDKTVCKSGSVGGCAE